MAKSISDPTLDLNSGLTILIPFKLKNPKTRLSGLLTLEERRNLAIFMLSDVLDSIAGCGLNKIKIAVPDEESYEACKEIGNFEVAIDERNLDDLVNYHISTLSEGEALAVIMADLPLLNPKLLRRFFDLKGDIVLSPGRKGGTNMLLVRNRKFEVSYHYGSFIKHVKIAKTKNLSFAIFDSFFSSVDVDDESDVLELLIHGEGKKSREYLLSLGYRVSCEEKDPKVVRVFD